MRPQPPSDWYVRAADADDQELQRWLDQQRQEEASQAKLHGATGQWAYPFAAVKQDANGFHIDWSAESGQIHDIRKVRPGQQIADETPGGAIRAYQTGVGYWEVTAVDVAHGRIDIKPVGDNPHVTGVGAGGKVFDESDYEILSGGAEKRIVDAVLDRIRKKQVATYSDVRYILLGTVPLQFGPNGGQGGWYSCTDLHNNRGGRKGMDARDIMMADAKTLQNKMNLQVPVAALGGSMDPHLWSSLVDAPMQLPTRPEEIAQLRLETEDFNNPKTMAEHVLEHPQPDVKYRNLELLKKRFRGEFPWQQATKENEDNIRERWLNGEFGEPGLREVLRYLSLQMATIRHPAEANFSVDPLWHIREQCIVLAQDLGWREVLAAYENATDPTNRQYVVWAYEFLKDRDGVLRMEAEETDPMVLEKVLNALRKLGVDSGPIVAGSIDRYRQVVQPTGEVVHDYHAKNLASLLGWHRGPA